MGIRCKSLSQAGCIVGGCAQNGSAEAPAAIAGLLSLVLKEGAGKDPFVVGIIGILL